MIIDPFDNLPGEDGAQYSSLPASLHVGVIRAVTPDNRYVVRVPSVNTTLDMPPCKALLNAGSLPVLSRVLVGFVDGEFEEMYIIGRIPT